MVGEPGVLATLKSEWSLLHLLSSSCMQGSILPLFYLIQQPGETEAGGGGVGGRGAGYGGGQAHTRSLGEPLTSGSTYNPSPTSRLLSAERNRGHQWTRGQSSLPPPPPPVLAFIPGVWHQERNGGIYGWL